MIVTDASVVITALVDETQAGSTARARLVDERLRAPELLDLEVASALRRRAAAGARTLELAKEAIRDLQRLPIERISHRQLLNRCWELRENVTICDASYVALAETLGAVLVTADKRLARAPGLRCAVEVLS